MKLVPPPRPKGQGRPPKVSSEITRTVRDALSDLCKHETAANLAGIGLRTFYLWRSLGDEDPKGPYGDFMRAVRGAEAKAQQTLSAAVALEARTDGRLALEVLHARWPKLWPKQTQVRLEVAKEVEAEIERALQAIGRALPEETFLRVLEAVAYNTESTAEGESEDAQSRRLGRGPPSIQ
jgi:hypothetical protein